MTISKQLIISICIVTTMHIALVFSSEDVTTTESTNSTIPTLDKSETATSSLLTHISSTKLVSGITNATEHDDKSTEMSTSMENAELLSSTESNSSTTISKEDSEKVGGDQHPWWLKDAIKDIAYYLRSHKFNEYDRRYHKTDDNAPSKNKSLKAVCSLFVHKFGNELDELVGNEKADELARLGALFRQENRTYFKAFPKPPLRALHWEVHKNCEPSFLQCVDYLRTKIKITALKRQDDTSVVIRESKWDKDNNSQQIGQVDMECRRMRERGDNVASPFEGPLERYQWRTTASYYMCWYTLNEVPDLKYIGESCDNFAYCLDMSFGPKNEDPRADDSKPFGCALYSFCPDPCCANKHTERLESCWSSEENPCFQENPAGQRECLFNRSQNTEFKDIILNRWNVSCKCPGKGYVWSSFYGMCIDMDECVQATSHECHSEGQACVNLPGSFRCVCRWGYYYSETQKKCVVSEGISEIKLNSEKRKKNPTKSSFKAFIRAVVRFLGKSNSSQ